MKVLLCGIWEPLMSTINHYIEAFREEGHELVTCGPIQGNYSGDFYPGGWGRSDMEKYRYDIPIHDRQPYPPWYTYREILEKCPWKPELIVQVEPHFFFQGGKSDRDNIPVVYLTFDNHRGPLTHIEAFKKGDIDHIFINSLHFIKPYQDALTTDRVSWLPVACNPRLHHPCPDLEEQCDIAFAGNPGINNSGATYEEWLNKTGVRNALPIGAIPHAATPSPDHQVWDQNISPRKFHVWKDPISVNDFQPDLEYAKSGDNILAALATAAPWEKYNNWEHREYNNRAEYLLRLAKDFNVRIYNACVWQNYARLIARGRLGFNCSLRNDINMKLFEYVACGKMMITDYVAGLEKLMPPDAGWVYYGRYYAGDNINFNLDYAEVKGKVELYLKHEDERRELARKGQEHVKNHHTYRHRVRQIIETMFK